MNDTVKLLVKIPKEMFQEMRDNDLISIETLNVSIKAIAHGIPLDDVKAKIDKTKESYMTSTKTSETYDEGVRFGLMLAYQIVDNIGKESEE